MPSDPIIVEVNAPQPRPDGCVRLSCRVRVDRAEPCEVWIQVPADSAPASDDWAAPLMVVRAMQAGRPLRIVGRVSPKLLNGIAEAQRVYAGFSGEFKPMPVTADEVAPTPLPAAPRTGACFSGGLDSWYTALSNGAALDDVIFGIGIDIPPDDHDRLAMVLPRIREAAAALGKPLTLFETNLRTLYFGSGTWATNYMGAALASCGLAMSGRYGRFLIPASFSRQYQHLHWSNSTRLDPLWSSEALEVVHDGPVSRVEKARLIATSEAALSTLRVCWRKETMAYNCGQCGKCVRTMIALRLVGALERCKTFDRPLDLRQVAALRYGGPLIRSVLLDLLAAAIEKRDDALADAMCESLAPGPPVASLASPTAPPHAPARLSPVAKVRRELARVLRRAADRLFPPPRD